jgi:L-ascorbate metabolism protein UlaG (beta-lactamase superfamily)
MKSSHYRDGAFQNRIDTPMYPEGSSTLSVMYHFTFDKTEHTKPDEPLPSIQRDLHTKPFNGSPVVTWFGHSTTLVQMDGKNILTDPIFSKRASPVSWAGPKAFEGTTGYSVDDLPAIDVVLISHDHYDHLDYNTIVALENKASIFIVPLGVGSHLEHWGIPLDKIVEVDWWTEIPLTDGLTIVSTPSRHFSGRGLAFGKTSWGSYIIQSGHHKVFFSGDSGYDIHFQQIGEKYGPFDLAMIETGQYNQLWPNIHMMPEQSVQAASDLHAKLLLPVHWSKFELALHPWNEPPSRALQKAEELHIQMITPLIGEAARTDSLFSVKRWWTNR